MYQIDELGCTVILILIHSKVFVLVVFSTRPTECALTSYLFVVVFLY